METENAGKTNFFRCKDDGFHLRHRMRPGADSEQMAATQIRCVAMSALALQNTASASCYAERPITLLSRHAKERVMAPIFREKLGADLCVDFGYDTDQLGTFTREIPRLLTQREAAARKARLAIERTGLPIGVGSEGAFGADPHFGVSPWNLELVVLVDAEREVEIVGIDEGPATFAHLVTDKWIEVQIFARDQGFPLQHLVVRPHGADDPRIRKDISLWSSLQSAFDWARRLAGDGRVFIETDGRAFANPGRMTRVARATEDLVRRLLSCCPACGTPGFGEVKRNPGLPCAACAEPTAEPLETTHECLKCAHRICLPVPSGTWADPAHCNACNP